MKIEEIKKIYYKRFFKKILKGTKYSAIKKSKKKRKVQWSLLGAFLV